VRALVRALLFGFVRLMVGAHGRWLAGADNDGQKTQRIYFANHGSHLDTLVVMAALPAELRARTHPVAALDYWGRNRLTRFIAVDCLGAVLIDRKSPAGSDPLEPLALMLRQGDSLVIFPEGTRGAGDVGAFKTGLYHLAKRFPGIDLVPVYLDNPQRAMPKGAALLVPLICSARFGAPLHLLAEELKTDFLERARSMLIAQKEAQP
jgi:1-acyl-sn-glycerol-3-phosphate acyltransferase